MDLPVHYFPVRPCPYKNDICLSKNKTYNQFMKFSDWGSHGNVDLREDPGTGVTEFKPQFGQQGIKHLNFVHPSVPLLDIPQQDCWNQRDAILGVDNYYQMIRDMRNVMFLKNIQKKFMKRNKKTHCHRQFTRLRRILENMNLDAETELSSRDTEMLSKLTTDSSLVNLRSSLFLQARIDQAFNESCWYGYNPDYYGGIVSHIPKLSSSKSFLIHASGEQFTDLCLTKISSLKRCPLSARIVHKESCGEPVYQIVSYPNSTSEGWCSTRHRHVCKVFKVDSQSKSFSQCASVSFEEETLTSVYYSPYLNNEVLMSTDKGSVYLWDINTRHRQLFQKSESSKMWTGIYLAGHPRQVLMADRNSLQMFDHRSNFSSPRTLFTTSESCQLLEHERILAASLVQFPYHVLLTDHSVLILDQRFVREPVLQWSHELPLSAPQYIQIYKDHCPELNERQDNTFLFVGAQQPAEVLCFPFNITTGQACTASSLPFRTTQPRDVFLNSETVPSCDTGIVKKRFEASLAGMTVAGLPQDQGFTVFQMDSYGDLFYQPYRIDHSDTALDFLAISDENTQATKYKCTKWMEAFKNIVEKDNEAFNKEAREVCLNNDLWSTLFSQDPNKCMEDFQPKMENVEFEYSSLSIPKQLSFTEHLPNRGANTRLLLALRNKESFGTLLEARETEHKKMRKRLQRMVQGGVRMYNKTFKSNPVVLSDSSDSDSASSNYWDESENWMCSSDSSDAEIAVPRERSKTNCLYTVDGQNNSLFSHSDSSELEPAESDISLVEFPKPPSKKLRTSYSPKNPQYKCAPRRKKATFKVRKGILKPVLKKKFSSEKMTSMGSVRRRSNRVKREVLSYCEHQNGADDNDNSIT